MNGVRVLEVQQFIYIVHVLFFVIHINNGRIVERTVDYHLKSMESTFTNISVIPWWSVLLVDET
jgi:hypothetical protein